MKNIKWETLDRLKNSFSELDSHDRYIYMPVINLAYYPAEPYRCNYYGIGVLQEGEIIFHIDLKEYHIQAPAIIFADTTSIKRWDKTRRSYEMETILFSEDFLQDKLVENNVLTAFSDLSNLGGFVSELSDEEFDNFKTIFRIIEHANQIATSHHVEVVRGMVYSMINEIAYLYEKYGNKTKALNTIDLRFRQAVAHYCKTERSVTFYATHLHLHPKYLSQVVSAETGLTASEWIQNQVVLEAKILLQDSSLSINSIAENMNFPDASTFGKYFKRYEGITPKQYRNTL